MLGSLLINAAVIVIGFALLLRAASEAIKRALVLAKHWGFSEFVISFLFIGGVAILPELLIGVMSALDGVPSFGAGIVIGSNIADLTLIVGLVALLSGGIRLRGHMFGNIKPLFLFIILPFALFLDGELSRIDGIVLVVSFIIYLFLMLKSVPKSPAAALGGSDVSAPKELLVLFLAVGVMIFSAGIIIDAAETINSAFAMPIFFIGIVVAVGTCLPEFILSLKSNRQRHGELGLGDILGNVFADCLLALGVIAIISPIKPDYPLLVLAAAFLMAFSMLALIVLSKSENRISRDEGAFLILLYFFFLAIQFGLELLISGGQG